SPGLDLHGQLARAGAHEIAGHTDEVGHVEVGEAGIEVPQNVRARVNLDRIRVIEEVREARLAVMWKRHESPGDADRPGRPELLRWGGVPRGVKGARPLRDRDSRAERVHAALAQRLELFLAASDQLARASRGLALPAFRHPARHGHAYRDPANRNASMNGSMSPSITASTLPISTFVRWSLISWYGANTYERIWLPNAISFLSPVSCSSSVFRFWSAIW